MSNAGTVTITTTTPATSSQDVSHPITSVTTTNQVDQGNGQIQKTEVITTKPGYTTTEFWITVFTTLVSLVVVVHPGFHLDSSLVQSLAVIAAAISSGLYSISRAKAKVG